MQVALSNLREELSENARSLKYIILTGAGKSTSFSDALWYNDLLDTGRTGSIEDDSALEERQASIDPDSSLAILMTSGSTGTPKAVVLTNFGVLNAVIGQWDSIGQYCSRCCVHSSMYHLSAGASDILLIAINQCTVIISNFTPDVLATMHAIQEEKCTYMLASPHLVRSILAHRERHKYDLSSLQYVAVGSTYVAPQLLRQAEAELRISRMSQLYGVTEGGGVIAHALYAACDDERRYTSIGRCLPHAEIKVVNSDGQIVPIGSDGEIYARSRHIMRGYHNDPVKTGDTITDAGWLRTGDIGRMDQDGYLYFIRRKKDIIIRAGRWIYPVEVEQVILEHSSVAEAYVFSIPDPEVDEVVCAFVKLKSDMQCGVEELKAFLVDKMNSYKIPTHIHFVDEFPRSALGKVPKYKLAEQMSKALE